MKKPSQILVVGDSWTGSLFADALQRRGLSIDLWVSEPAPSGAEAVYLGNGETRAKAGLIFGEELAAAVWGISQANSRRAAAFLRSHAVAFQDSVLQRVEAAGTTEEPALSFTPSELASRLQVTAPPTGFFRRLKAVRAEGALDCRLVLETSSGDIERNATMAVIATEYFEQTAVPWLADKRIPVSLSSFLFSPTPKFSASAAFFHGGADFAFQDGKRLRLGSFRNLFADRGVGLHTEIDSFTRENVAKFFQKVGWVATGAEFESELRVESISCDGLPLVGTVPGIPSAIFATGFAARGPCFLFEVAERVAATVAGEGADLALFSPRRLL